MANPEYIDPQGYLVGADGTIRSMTSEDGGSLPLK